jgi:hypothetical protein
MEHDVCHVPRDLRQRHQIDEFPSIRALRLVNVQDRFQIVSMGEEIIQAGDQTAWWRTGSRRGGGTRVSIWSLEPHPWSDASTATYRRSAWAAGAGADKTSHGPYRERPPTHGNASDMPPTAQGKIERWHRTVENWMRLEIYYLSGVPGEMIHHMERQIQGHG